MEEVRVITCKQCGVPKKAIQDGYYPNGKDKVWRDEHGKLFNGRLCAECHVSKMVDHKRSKEPHD